MIVFTISKFLSDAQVNVPQSGTFKTGLPTVPANSGTLQPILQIAFGVIGALALMFIVIAAVQFVISGGDPQRVSKARQTVLFAAAGLAVAVLAEVIVTYVLFNVQ